MPPAVALGEGKAVCHKGDPADIADDISKDELVVQAAEWSKSTWCLADQKASIGFTVQCPKLIVYGFGLLGIVGFSWLSTMKIVESESDLRCDESKHAWLVSWVTVPEACDCA